jgi:hypothetical protein
MDSYDCNLYWLLISFLPGSSLIEFNSNDYKQITTSNKTNIESVDIQRLNILSIRDKYPVLIRGILKVLKIEERVLIFQRHIQQESIYLLANLNQINSQANVNSLNDCLRKLDIREGYATVEMALFSSSYTNNETILNADDYGAFKELFSKKNFKFQNFVHSDRHDLVLPSQSALLLRFVFSS